jgi:hypothetical protein
VEKDRYPRGDIRKEKSPVCMHYRALRPFRILRRTVASFVSATSAQLGYSVSAKRDGVGRKQQVRIRGEEDNSKCSCDEKSLEGIDRRGREG